jgi:hypothetical protein
MIARLLGMVVAVAYSVGWTAASATNLKPFDPAALQDTVEATGKELQLPGALVLLHTPQGDFVFGYGGLSWVARPHRAPTRISGSPRIPRR